jgi:dienelactone hydrolase/pimeloyl-ACP methyl ester carboxylesterase
MDFLNRLPHMLQDYTVGRLRQLEAEHVARKLAMKTKAEALEYQHDTWEKLRLVFGPEPRRTPLKPRITGGFERKAYRVENVIFESRPSFPVTGNLYLPKGREFPAPCVLGVCGHSMNGKAYEAYQHFAQGLATKGYVVFIFDPLGQGERMQYPDGSGGSRYGGSVLDHIQAGNQQRLVGEWLGAWRAWDGIRALDYLLSREEADPTQVGLTGCSGGGTLTTWLLACDRRFTMAAPSCYVTTWRRNLENELPADSEQNPPLALALGLDVDDLLAMHAPRPLMLLTEELDFFDIRGTEEILGRLQHVYRLLGKPDNLGIYTGPLGHGYSQGQREAMYGWFNRATGKTAETGKEPKLTAEADEVLWATKSGQVAELSPPNVAAFTAEAARKLAARRKPLEGEALRKALRQLLNLSPRRGIPDYRILRPTEALGEGLAPTAYAVETEPGIQTVVAMVGPSYLGARIPLGKQATVYVPHLSADQDLREEALAQELMAGKRRLFAVDLRSLGESRPNTCGGVDNWLTPYGSEFFYAYWMEMLGDNMAGRRVHDLLSVLDVLQDRGYGDIHLAGRGWGSLPALFAAVLDDRVTQVSLKHVPLSLAALAEDEDYRWPLSGMVPGLLRKLDLPDCYRALGRRVRVTEPWSARAEVMSAAAAQAAVKAYGLPAGLLKS